MRTQVLFLSAALVISFTACGQSENKVPEKVRDSFIQKFQGADHVKWGKESKSEWEAEFKLNGKNYSANFDQSGTWIETEYELNMTEIPAPVKAALDKAAPGSKIRVAEVTETNEGIAYEIVTGTGRKKTELIIDGAGNVVKKE